MTANQSTRIKIKSRYASWQNRRRIARLAGQVADQANAEPDAPMVVMFNATARLTGLSLNAAFALLTGWALRLAGANVVHFVCNSGMSHCVLGTNREDYESAPPCEACIHQSQRLYAGAQTYSFAYLVNVDLDTAVAQLNISELSEYIYPSPISNEPIPLGKLVLPSIRWALRRHTLLDDKSTRYLFRQYILSAYNIALRYDEFITQLKPSVGVIFNGAMYPEATARWVSKQRGLRTVAHEVGFQRYSTFFTESEPTAYPVEIPDEFELSPEQNAQLDAYLEKRFQGNFSMAGIQFWPEMRGLDQVFLDKIANFKQIVPIFTNVVYDTSQAHANVMFPHMFAWLDTLLGIIHSHPETLFVIRAHPDEMRIGTAKLSNETVEAWVEEKELHKLNNIEFVKPNEYLSSYELIQKAKFVIVYNSSIGLEATLFGKAVICGGKARYTQYPIVYFPDSVTAMVEKINELLSGESIQVPAAFIRNARRFLYHQLYLTSILLDEYIQEMPRMGFVGLKSFSWQSLLAENSTPLDVITAGILEDKPFLMP